VAVAREQQRLRGVLRGPEYEFAPHGDLSALEEVVELCCDIWNGAGSLILPIPRSGRVTGGHEQYLETRQIGECFVKAPVTEKTEAMLRALGLNVGRFDPHFIRRPTCTHSTCSRATGSRA
jgi:hypothetical protein